MIFAYNDYSNDKLKYGKVVSIVKDHVNTESIQIPSNTDFAIKVDFEFNSHMKNRQIYTLKQA